MASMRTSGHLARLQFSGEAPRGRSSGTAGHATGTRHLAHQRPLASRLSSVLFRPGQRPGVYRAAGDAGEYSTS